MNKDYGANRGKNRGDEESFIIGDQTWKTGSCQSRSLLFHYDSSSRTIGYYSVLDKENEVLSRLRQFMSTIVSIYMFHSFICLINLLSWPPEARRPRAQKYWFPSARRPKKQKRWSQRPLDHDASLRILTTDTT